MGPGRRRAVVAASLATVAITACISGTGVAEANSGSIWSKPETVLGADHRVSGLQLAAARRGYAVAVWESGRGHDAPAAAAGKGSVTRRVMASTRRSAKRRFGRPRAISPPNSFGPRLVMSPDGQTIVTWVRGDGRVQAVFTTPTGGWSPVQTLAGPSVATAPLLAIGSDGTALAAWHTGPAEKAHIAVALRAPDLPFQSPQTVAATPDVGSYLAVAAGRAGSGAVAWTRKCPLLTKASFAQPDGSFTTPETIPGASCPTGGISIAMDDSRDTVALVDGSSQGFLVKATSRPAGGSFTTAQRISTGLSAGHQLGMSGRGRAVAVWGLFSRQGNPRGIAASVRPPGGAFATPQRISGRNGGGIEVLAVNRCGHAVAVWQSLRSFQLKANYLSTRHTFGPPERVSPPLSHDSLALPQVAIDPSGRAVVAWSRPTRTGNERGVFVAQRMRHSGCP
jgi:hypothetical protein